MWNLNSFMYRIEPGSDISNISLRAYRKSTMSADMLQRALHVRDINSLGAVPIQEAFFVRESRHQLVSIELFFFLKSV